MSSMAWITNSDCEDSKGGSSEQSGIHGLIDNMESVDHVDLDTVQ